MARPDRNPLCDLVRTRTSGHLEGRVRHPLGSTVVTGSVSRDWYVITVPATDLAKGAAVDFYATSGRLLGTGPISTVR